MAARARGWRSPEGRKARPPEQCHRRLPEVTGEYYGSVGRAPAGRMTQPNGRPRAVRAGVRFSERVAAGRLAKPIHAACQLEKKRQEAKRCLSPVLQDPGFSRLRRCWY